MNARISNIDFGPQAAHAADDASAFRNIQMLPLTTSPLDSPVLGLTSSFCERFDFMVGWSVCLVNMYVVAALNTGTDGVRH